jgi:RNA polymerase sigma-70 factor (ECF subfamily)
MAWLQLVEAHQQIVFRLAYLILGDPYEAEDVAQETFLRAFKALDRFDPDRALRPWLLTIAKNLARNRSRSLGRYWHALKRFWMQNSSTHTQNPEAVSFENITARTLWEAIRRLRDADQEVIYLRYFLDLSSREAAQALDIAPGTVKSRLHRSLKRLEAVIAADFPNLREDHT